MSVAIGQIKTAYDEVPYASFPFPQTAPENLAAIAWLFGLDAAPPVGTARVLELGCSSGGNLVPFAARHPEARLLGVDLSGVQVEIGKRRIAELRLENIELMEADLSELDAGSLGTFDYIICHGVYSWVPPHVQEAILRICRECLSANGIAYVSYNTYPGWKAKEIVRDAMMLRGGPRATAVERLSYGKGMLDFLERVAPRNSILSKALEATLPDLRQQQDYYIAHEYLEPFNAPCYLQEFVQRANHHGLAYLAEATPSVMFASNYGEQVAEPLLKECGHSQVVLEQYLDFIVNRTFRQTLLVHDAQAQHIRYRLEADRLRAFHFAADLPCLDGPTRPDATVQTFGRNGSVVTTRSPEVKAVLQRLTAAWPATVSYAELLSQAGDASGRAQIDDMLELLLIRGMARFRLDPVCVKKTDHPMQLDSAIRRAAELSRDEGQPASFNPWHEPVLLQAAESWLLPELDGTKDRADLIALLRARVLEGKVRFERNGAPVGDATAVENCIVEHVDALPSRLAALKLLKN